MKKIAVILITLALLVGIIISMGTVAAPPPSPGPGPPSNPMRVPAFSLGSLVVLGAALFGLALRRIGRDKCESRVNCQTK